VPLNWTTTDQSSVLNGVKMLVYGESGIGKTVLCGTSPSPVILSAENGLLSLARYRYPVLVIRSHADLMDAYRWLASSAEASRVETACVDGASEIAEVLLAQHKAAEKDPRKAYLAVQETMLSALRAFRDLPRLHVLITAKMSYEKDEATGAFKYVPSMPGRQLGPQLPYLFDEVFRMGIWQDPASKQSHRFLQTGKDPQYDAKDRSGLLDHMEPPNISAVIRKIKGEK
jgi:hypothetical protein